MDRQAHRVDKKVLSLDAKREENKDRREKLQSRVENCFWHLELGEAGECQYCKHRTALSYKIIHAINEHLLGLYPKYKLEFTNMDIRYVLKEAFERMTEIEQEMAEHKANGDKAEGEIRTFKGGEEKTPEGNNSVAETDNSTDGN